MIVLNHKKIILKIFKIPKKNLKEKEKIPQKFPGMKVRINQKINSLHGPKFPDIGLFFLLVFIKKN